ncbi:MAG TPA: hydroxymethylglutaryl-CoA reductase, degradative [Candidatus Thermoplasmatota archaeon]|nr:hydroxymethylglutaryl-CoA reductase, degradative [Candidatus Thermoplasmatota archaeon]
MASRAAPKSSKKPAKAASRKASAGAAPASPWSGFHKRSRADRLALVARHGRLTAAESKVLGSAAGLGHGLAGSFIENAAGAFPLPLGLAVGFVVDGRDVVVPMAVEESSVVAAASHGAKMAAAGGGFTTEAGAPVTIGQVELRDVDDPEAAALVVERNAAAWAATADRSIASMVRRGGGVRGIVARPLPEHRRLVVHLHVDTRDAMGANAVNSLCESLGPAIAKAVGGRLGLRILSNLATERIVRARCTVPAEAVGGKGVVRAMVEANEFALADPYRAATHNKGILNGIDPVAIATGNDWRALEAGAHAYAALGGRYKALTQYSRTGAGDLRAELALPVAVGTVGGVTRLHPTAAVCLKLLGAPDATGLARILAAVGLAQNLSALRALSAEGIQAGHMALHSSNLRLAKRA